MPANLSSYQVQLPSSSVEAVLQSITSADLSFRGRDSGSSGHNTHAFAAKFPPQLPRLFIEALTEPGETVLDPMAGSGTTLVEAALLGRRGLGVDLDPLAALITQAKVLPISAEEAASLVSRIEADARQRLSALDEAAWGRWLRSRHPKTAAFIDYWFDSRTARELQSLAAALRDGSPGLLAPLLQTLFSSVIVTKSGGVSRARDLAHSRPHRVSGKQYRDAIKLFSEKASKAIASLAAVREASGTARALAGDARHLPLPDESIDLIVTSPPYANAIDYVRAHKFSLVWLGREIPELTEQRRRYIGAESRLESQEDLPAGTARAVVSLVEKQDRSRARVIRRYFVEMRQALSEMQRVLKPGRAAVVVVGASTVRGVTIPTPFALAELAETAGFKLVSLRDRPIDRDRRLLPTSRNSSGTGIEARMHTEQVICLLKWARPD
jgi:DNA modification methylase